MRSLDLSGGSTAPAFWNVAWSGGRDPRPVWRSRDEDRPLFAVPFELEVCPIDRVSPESVVVHQGDRFGDPRRKVPVQVLLRVNSRDDRLAPRHEDRLDAEMAMPPWRELESVSRRPPAIPGREDSRSIRGCPRPATG